MVRSSMEEAKMSRYICDICDMYLDIIETQQKEMEK